MRRTLALAPLLVVALTGCPPSMGEVADQFAPKLNAHHAEVKKVVSALPAPGSLAAPTAATGLTPAPVYDEDKGTYTMDLVHLEQVEDPKVELRLVPDKLDLILSNVYVLPVRDVGPEGMTAEDRAHASYELYSKRFEAALALRYLAVVRTLSYEKPVATSETEFEGGAAKFEVFLIDTQDKTVKASFPVDARSKPSVEYVYQEGKDDKKERLAAFARSTLWEDAREKIAEGLRTHAGATVVFD